MLSSPPPNFFRPLFVFNCLLPSAYRLLLAVRRRRERRGAEGEAVAVKYLKSLKAGNDRPGTGDVFASIIAAQAVKGVPLPENVRKAAHFVKQSILVSDELNVPIENGVCFEEILSLLIRQ